MLWGAHAKSYKEFINSENNLILEHSHPSPLSRKPFVGNNHFILCNDYLKVKNIKIMENYPDYLQKILSVGLELKLLIIKKH